MAGDYVELAYVCAPLVTFKGLPTEPAQPGQSLSLKVRLFGFMPPMPHQIDIVHRDDAARTLESSERGWMIRTWRHRIEVTPTPGGAILRDHIEIDAGVLTPLVSAWARVFYRHRHRRRHVRIAALSPTFDS